MYIYKITNTKNNKVYIGQTTQKANHRWTTHLSELKRNVHPNSHLQNAFNLYGESKFQFEILDESANSLDELNKLEIQYINEYKSMNSKYGYNKLSGGKNEIVSEELKQKHKNRMKRMYASGWKHPMLGKKHKKSSIEQMLNSRKIYYKTHSHALKGSKMPEMQRIKIKNAWNVYREENPIKLITPQNEVMNLTISTREFCRLYLDIKDRRSIDRVLSGEKKSHKGWRLA